ncbi:MAG: UvrD-helicase domain-containing protein [Synergistaceae bacterium]|nr:UvrD-helicase domain-containing protein [Synergistaceae bacterium]
MNFSLPPNTPQGQADAITANEKLITVGAGAGTGKTWVLTERYTRLLMEDNELSPSEILTLTYTEAAAGEMKARITHRVQEALKDVADPERKRVILDGLADLWISTIHSFAARLIRESGLSLDIDPGASVITTQQENDFWDTLARAAEFAKLGELARTYGDKKLRELADSLDNSNSHNNNESPDSGTNFSAIVAKWGAYRLSRFACETAELHASSGRSWQEMLDWLEDDSLIDSAKGKLEEVLLPEWREVWEIFADVPELPMPKTKKSDSAGVIFNNMLAKYRGRKPDKRTLQDFYSDLMQANSVNGQPFTALKQYLYDLPLGEWKKTRPKPAREITPHIDDSLTHEELTTRKTLLTFCALSWGMWDTMKRRRGLLSFSDMINHARTAISNNAVTRKFKHILVDEFQDTDPLQFGMIQALAEKHDAYLFVVGDLKQSIYRFRHADPSLFANLIDIKADRRVNLDTSFRTKADLLAVINSLFSEIWRNGLGKAKPMNTQLYHPVKPITSDSERDSGTMPKFTVILSPHSTSSLEQARKNLAEELARKIHDWVREQRTIWDKKAQAIRPVKYADFAVLTPARSIYPVLEDALDKFGIKSIQDKSTDYFARGEVSDVVCLLRAAADVNDDFAVAGWLMSPFSGVSEDDALRVLTLVNDKTRPITLVRENFPEAYSRLEYYALVGEHEGPAGLVELFDRNRQWLSCYKPNDRMRVLRNIRLAVQVAREFQRSGTSSLSACAEWLTRTVRNEVPYEEPAWHDDRENAVRLGTVHSAKGLEYPVTVVFDQRTKKKANSQALRPSRELGLVFTRIPDEITKGQEITPKLSAWESLLADEGEEEEQTRLFYVAATRAQDSLIFCGMTDANAGQPHKHTWTKLLCDKYDDFSPVTAQELTPDVFPEVNGQDSESPLHPVSIVHAKNSLRQISATSFALYEWCPFAWRRSYKQGRTLTWEDPADKAESFDQDGYTGGAEVGSIAHWILARWPEGEDYEAELDRWLHDKAVLSLLPGHLRAAWRRNDKNPDSPLREWLLRFAGSDTGKLLRSRTDIQREKAFRVSLNEYTSLAGAVDAVFGNEIIDYKITSVENAPKGLYESQLDFYALVLHMMTGAESVKSTIAFLREGKTESRVITDFAGIQERVIIAAEECACGEYLPNHKHCGDCPYKKGCVNYNAGVQE